MAAVLLSFGCTTIATAGGTGKASYYSTGSRTANGESFNPSGLTAAHRTYAFGTLVKVTNLKNGRSVILRINDRGPFIKGRIIDVSKGAAAKLGMISSGVVQVKVEPLKGKKKQKRAH